MEENIRFRRRKSTEERLFTKKQVDELLKESKRKLDVQYSVLKEVYESYGRLKKEHEQLKEKLLRYENPDDGYRKDWT